MSDLDDYNRFLKPYTSAALAAFIIESNRIEGIATHETRMSREIKAMEILLDKPEIDIDDLVGLVAVLQPDAQFRESTLVPDVRVGNHIAPPSGPAIYTRLDDLLQRVKECDNPWEVHNDYEILHPFTDGNGRSGRALWAWQMIHQTRPPYDLSLGFLHIYYYQTLSGVRNDG